MIRFIILLSSILLLFFSIKIEVTSNKNSELIPKQNLNVYFDVSKSISNNFFNISKEYLDSLNNDFKINVNLFSSFSNSESILFDNNFNLENLRANFKKTNLEQTSFQSIINSDKNNILLISDGFFNKDYDLLVNDEKLIDRKINVFIPDNIKIDALNISNFSAPKFITNKTNFYLKLEISNDSSSIKNGIIKIFDIDNEIYSFDLNLRSNEKFYKKLKINELKSKKDFFRAELITDTTKRNKTLYVNELKRSKILIISRLKKEEEPLTNLLKESGFSIEAYLNSEIDSKLEFEKFDLLIFNNVHKNELPFNYPKLVKEYTGNGGKFLMLGGNKSFGLGAYKNTEIEEVLPVLMEEPKKKQKRLNLAVQLLIDKSESMKYGQKLDYAKLAAREVIRNLKDEDYFGLIGFEDNPFFAMRIAKLDKNRERAISRVGLLFPAGGTQLLPALDRARREIQKVNSGKKHLIILTDGKLPDGSFNARYYLQLVSELRLSGVTVSVFLMGDSSDTLLKQIAENGKGRFYQTTSAGKLPSLFIEDVKKSGNEITKQEVGPYKVSNLDADNLKNKELPDLFGFVQTKLKSNSKLSLSIKQDKENFPLLAFYKYKAGISAAFTSDLNSRWSKKWFSWNYLLNFINYLFSNLELSNENSGLDFNYNFLTVNGNGLVKLNIFSDYNPDDLRIKILNKQKREVNFETVNNTFGSYSLNINNISPGIYSLILDYKDKKSVISYFFANEEDIFDVEGRGVNRGQLTTIAKLSGGKINPKVVDLLFNQEIGNTSDTKSDFNYILLAIALGFIIIDLVYRKFSGRINS